MPQRNDACPKCRAKMEVGTIADNGYNRTFVSSWIAGVPEKGFFGLKTRGKKQFEITAYRCPSCGYLESYAGP
jgi:uncharacterized OB-fold protein